MKKIITFNMNICMFLIVMLNTVKGYGILPKYNVSALYLETISNLITTYIQDTNKTGPTAIILQKHNASDISMEVTKLICSRQDLQELIVINPDENDKFYNKYEIYSGIKTVFWITERFDNKFWEYFTNYTTCKMWDAGSYLFFLTSSYQDFTASFINVFQKLFIEYRALNLVIVNHYYNKIQDGKGKLDKTNVYGYNPYLNVVTEIDVFDGNAFTDKTLNVYGYNCTVAIKNQLNDIFEDAVKNKDYYGTYLEYHMVKLITEKFNSNVIYFTPEDDEYFDHLYDIPIKDRPIVVGSASVLSSRAMYYSCYPHEQQSITVLVPKAQRIPQYLSLILPFSINTWTVYFISIPLIVLSLKLLKKDMSLESWTFLEVTRVLLSGSFNWSHSAHKQRLFILCCMYYSLVILNAYQGCITSYITVPQFYKDINTATDLLDSELPFYIQSQVNQQETVNALLEEMSDPDIASFISRFRFCNDIKQVLNWIAFYRNVSFLTGKYYADIFINMDTYYRDGFPLLHLVEETLGLLLVIFEAPYSNPFKDRLDIITRRLYEHGFRTKIGRDVMFLTMLSGGANHNQSPTLKPLELEHLFLAFYFLLSGICVSVVIFCAEIFLQKVTDGKSVLQIASLTENQILI